MFSGETPEHQRTMTLTDELRSFNRFYTREKMSPWTRFLPGGDLSLPEARVLYEIAAAARAGGRPPTSDERLRMDKAHLSRIVARFRAQRLRSPRQPR